MVLIIPENVTAEQRRKILEAAEYRLEWLQMMRRAAAKFGDLDSYRVFRRAEKIATARVEAWRQVQI